MERKDYINLAAEALAEHCPNAIGAFAGGSLMRGQGNPTSDIDMVVLFEHIERPYRIWLGNYNGVPFDIFCHDAQTLRHFVQEDYNNRRPALLGIIADAVLLGQDKRLPVWQRYARQVLQKPLPALQPKKLLDWRYRLTTQLEDYVDVTDAAEHAAIAVHLFTLLQDAVCLLANQQLGGGKWRGRLTKRADAVAAEQLRMALAFDLANPDAKQLLPLGDALLLRMGGRLTEKWIDYGAADNRKEKLCLFSPQQYL